MPKKPNWDALVATYNQAGFIQSDPIQFPHRYQHHSDVRDAELAALLSALMSYGQRPQIIKTIQRVLQPIADEPVAQLMALKPSSLKRQYRNLVYRFNTAEDFITLMALLRQAYLEYGSLQQLWQQQWQIHGQLPQAIQGFRNAILKPLPASKMTYGMTFWWADPVKNSAAKRFNMFLRWMVRRDAVDLGLWQHVMSPAHLVFPLDTHVGTMARRYNITQRASNDWKTAEAITRYFRRFNAADPVRYDFALFGLGIANKAPNS